MRDKLFDTWYWQRDDGERVPIQVRLEKEARDDKWKGDGTRNEPPFETLWTRLFVELDGQRIESTDVESLRLAVWAALDKKYEIKWTRYFLVQVDPSRPYHGLGTGFVMSYDDIEKGVTWDGKELLRKWESRGYKVSPWPGAFTDKQGKIQACIVASEKNRRGLEEFVQRIMTLREMLRSFLEPGKLEALLQNLAASTLLPAVDRKLIGLNEGKKGRREKEL